MTNNQLQYWANQELARSNRAKEDETHRSNLAKEAETYRTNVSNEAIKRAINTETHRSNLANELLNTIKAAETRRHNRKTEQQELSELAETIRYQRSKNTSDRIAARAKAAKYNVGAASGILDLLGDLGLVRNILKTSVSGGSPIPGQLTLPGR